MKSDENIKLVTSSNYESFNTTNLSDLSRTELEREVAYLRNKVAGLQNAVTFDVVSGLLKPHAFAEQANAEFRRTQRYEKELTLVVISILDFEDMKEKHGLDACDHYITSLAQMCESACRQGSDILGRVSDNQFAVLLPEADMSACKHFKKRLKQEFDSFDIDWNGASLRSTMKLSAGVLLDHDTSFKDLYIRTVNQHAGPLRQLA